jgi:hypothetical protein
VPPGTKRIDVADRANAEIDRYTRYGQYLGTLRTPAGSLPCDIDYLGRYAVVGALDGPDRSKGAPIYIYEDDRLVSTLFPKDDLGLANFKHVHNAVLRQWNGKLYVIAQAWNPGDFRGARADGTVAPARSGRPPPARSAAGRAGSTARRRARSPPPRRADR